VVLFFHFAYACVIFLAGALVAFLPGLALGLVLPRRRRESMLPAVAVATAAWIWTGWLGPRYGISRLGLILFSGSGALGLLCGWRVGVATGSQARRRTPG
jgi:hypothetical protein